MKKSFFSAGNLARLGVFIALLIVLNITRIGLIPLGPISVTTLHVPVLVGAVLFGLPFGAILGLVFGLMSLFNALQGTAGPLSFLIVNPLVSVVPRVAFGAIAGVIADRMREKHSLVSYAVPAFVGSMMNTILFLGTLALFFSEEYAMAMEIPQSAVLGAVGSVALVNGLPEAIVATLITTGIAKAYESATHRTVHR